VRPCIEVTYKHCGAKVKLVEELGDEDVRLDNLLLVDFLDAAQDVQQPLELPLTGRHPDEVHLRRQTYGHVYSKVK